MKIIKKIFTAIVSKIISYYILLVYKTSKITITGCHELVNTNKNDEKFVIGLWHGESHCCYPLLKNTDTYMVTTTNRRGDYISNIGKHFGYIPLRLPDESKGENYVFKMRSMINGPKKHNIVLTLDGPSGPYHEPKKFALITALITKRKMILVCFKFKRKIQLKKRWDKYIIPLPFCRAEVHFHEPIEITKGAIEKTGKEITRMMEVSYK